MSQSPILRVLLRACVVCMTAPSHTCRWLDPLGGHLTIDEVGHCYISMICKMVSSLMRITRAR
jgi:hypothetical protein